MIVCNKCGEIIIEPDEVKEDTTEELTGKKRYAKKEEPAVPARRPSLVSLPDKRGVNCFIYADVDLCSTCQAILKRQVEEVQFKFIKERLVEEQI